MDHLKIGVYHVRFGLAMALICLMFGIGMGVSFGIAEDAFKAHVDAGIAAHPALHDSTSASSILRWALRAHFHATGISAFCLALIAMIVLSPISAVAQRWTAIGVGLGGLYPFAWFTMFWVGPELGRKAAHEFWLVKLFTYVGIGGLLLGMAGWMLALLVAGFGLPRQIRS